MRPLPLLTADAVFLQTDDPAQPSMTTQKNTFAQFFSTKKTTLKNFLVPLQTNYKPQKKIIMDDYPADTFKR